jgi:hypothetical protein
MNLIERINTPEQSIDEIGTYLDGLSHEDRLAETRTLSRKNQRKLYEKAADAKPLSLEYFVPSDQAERSPVIHEGWNTLPLPGAIRTFQKRFCRPDGDSSRLFGYNHGATMGLIGPGFFVGIPTEGNADWEARGAIVIDYFQTPDSDVAEDWPKVVPNSKGLQRFVYYQTRDFMRRVSEHVSVGAAYKVEKPLGQYFMLCREPLS